MQRLLMHLGLVLVASCWRESPAPAGPQRSFVARVSSLAELRRGTDDVQRRLLATRQRIAGLASEAEREALHGDILALEYQVIRLGRILVTARTDGEDPDQLTGVAIRLRGAMSTIAQLRWDLRHTRTNAEIEAFEALKRKLEGTHDPGDLDPRIDRRRGPLLTPLPDVLIRRR